MMSFLVVLILLLSLWATLEQAHQLYDRDIALFSNEGKLLQVEYARKAGRLGTTVLAGLAGKEAVLVIPTSKRLHLLRDASDKVMRVNDDCFVAVAGLAGDGRAAARHLRSFSLAFWRKFGIVPTTLGIAQDFADSQHMTTRTGGRRPLGVQVLVIGYNKADGCMELFEVDPSGQVAGRAAAAIGQQAEHFMAQMESKYELRSSCLRAAEVLDELCRAKAEEEGEACDYYLIQREAQRTTVRQFSSMDSLRSALVP